jgi:hypothetical protein
VLLVEVFLHYHSYWTWLKELIFKKIFSKSKFSKENIKLVEEYKQKNHLKMNHTRHFVLMLELTTLIMKMKNKKSIYKPIFQKTFYKTSSRFKENLWFIKILNLNKRNNKKQDTFIKVDSIIWLMIGKNKSNHKKQWTFLL